MANAVAGHTMDFDFSYLIGQMVAPIIPALLPLAESIGATPAETMAAFMVGFEVASRLGRASPEMASVAGWHATSAIGVIGTAAACARLLKVPAARIPDVLGISVSMAGGVGANYGTMTKPLHSGLAARNGILAARLGSRGFTANPAAIEGRDGFFGTFLRGLKVPMEAFEDLGRSSDLAERGFKLKRYPCGGQGHTAIDTALLLRDSLAPRLADVAGIRIGVTKYAAKRVSAKYPTSVEGAKFSAPYVVGYALVHGAPRIAAFTEEALRDDAVKAVAQKVSLTVDPEFADVFDEAPSRTTVTFADGQTIEQARYYASGSSKFPLTPAQIEDKFHDCAAQAIEKPAADNILATLNRLGDQPSFQELWPLLARA
jgi:2-methylcitrate dehydratase PrpD